MVENGTIQDPVVKQNEFDDYDLACHSKVCSGCSCLCDDISYYVKDGRLVRTLNLCEIAMKRIRTISAEDRVVPLSSHALDHNLNAAAELLKTGKAPLILGADALDENAIVESRKLAERLNGIWMPWGVTGINRFYRCAKTYGWATALLDEIRDRADAVIFWRADPLDTHHRHLSRYSYFPRGRYTERGNSDRTLIGVADQKMIIEPLCQQFFMLKSCDDSRFLKALMTPPQAEPYDHRDFPLLINSLQRASYIAVFVDAEKTAMDGLNSLFEWAANVNLSGRKRAVILPLSRTGANIEGFKRISLEHHNVCGGFDYSGTLTETDTVDALKSAAEISGCVLMVESGPEGANRILPPEIFSEKKLIVLNHFKQEPYASACVSIPLSLPGVETGGIFFRAEGLPLLTEKIEGLHVEAYPSGAFVLKELLNRID
ncbi:MAG: hypothetical protein R6U50_00060 [Desulfobacterales bacterium]